MLIKRLFDIAISLILLIVLSFVIIIVAITISIRFRENPIFVSKRSGYLGRSFTIYKFKSMPTMTDENGQMLSDEQRITNFGKLLRASSLDELPQLINVLFGQMSLVGPRPLNEEYLKEYSKKQKRRLWVKPGITGWAQVNGRNSISWDKKFELDGYYVEHQNFLLDMKILVLTIFKVISHEGISADGFVNTSSFKRENSET